MFNLCEKRKKSDIALDFGRAAVIPKKENNDLHLQFFYFQVA